MKNKKYYLVNFNGNEIVVKAINGEWCAIVDSQNRCDIGRYIHLNYGFTKKDFIKSL